MKKILTIAAVLLLAVTSVFARPKVALVLSGGGARGIMHIPVLQELERRGIYPDIVTGTSMGGLVGGLYAAGYPADEIYDIVMNENLFSVAFSMLETLTPENGKAYDEIDRNVYSIAFGREGVGASNSLLSDRDINTFLRSLIVRTADVRDFDDLSIPFRSIGTDFKSGEEVVFASGSLFDALRSTMSMPIVFPPYVLEDGRYMVDGGVVNNLPVEVARSLGADLIIAVDVNEDVRARGEDTDSLDTLSGVVIQYIVLTVQNTSTRQYHDVDHLLIPDTGEYLASDFMKVSEIMARGEEFVASSQEFFDSVEEALSGFLPLEKPAVSYKDRQYSYVNSVEVPERLRKYSSLLGSYKDRLYTEEFVSTFDELLETLKYRENLRSIGYDYEEGVIRLYTQDYINLQSLLSVGLKGGLDYRYSPETGHDLTLDGSISWSARIRHHGISYDLALKFGQQNHLLLGFEIPVAGNLYWNAGAGGGVGAFSAVSAGVFWGRFLTIDWNFNANTGFSWRPSEANRLDFGLRGDFLILGKDESATGTAERIWQQDWLYMTSACLSYHYDDLSDNMLYSTLHNDIMAEFRAGYSRGFIWQLQADYSGFFRLFKDSYLDLSATVFSSRYPYELASSYRMTPFGVSSRDYLSASALGRYNLTGLLEGLYAGAGLFLMAYDNDALSSYDGYLLPDGASLLPFSAISEIKAGAAFKTGFYSQYGTAELSLLVTLRGEVALSIRFL